MTRVGALAAAALLAALSSARAFTAGGGPEGTDCLAEFDGTAANYPLSRPREIRCTDNDSSCDDDPTLGVCQFQVRVCFNVTDPLRPTCAPADIESFSVQNEQPDTNPEHDFDFQTLEDGVTFLTIPVDHTEMDVCSPSALMNVPVGIKLFPGGGLFKRATKALRTTTRGPLGVFDGDKLKLTCQPAGGTTPCDGVTSTFDQIQRHVFQAASCTRSTCHNIAQSPHLLSLAPTEAWADLVGVAPTNSVAASTGKLRVDPGNPANSFILDKLKGSLLPNEGERMPRGLKKLKPTAIDLVTEWIAAGAPATGFVASVGCPAP